MANTCPIEMESRGNNSIMICKKHGTESDRYRSMNDARNANWKCPR